MIATLTRRRSLTFVAGSVAAIALTSRAAVAAPKTFVCFGDSYTRTLRAGIPTWADQIDASGAARVLVNMAVSGATAAGTNGMKTLDGQVDRWIAGYKAAGVPDRTVIYMGNNDVAFGPASLSAALNRYDAQVDRLIANGVTLGSRRLVLCLLHDWSRNPNSTRSFRRASDHGTTASSASPRRARTWSRSTCSDGSRTCSPTRATTD